MRFARSSEGRCFESILQYNSSGSTIVVYYRMCIYMEGIQELWLIAVLVEVERRAQSGTVLHT